MRNGRLLLIAPSAALIGVVLLAPLGMLLVISLLLGNPNGGVVWGSFSFDAYTAFLFERGLLRRAGAELGLCRDFRPQRGAGRRGDRDELRHRVADRAVDGVPTPEAAASLLVFLVTLPGSGPTCS